MFAPDEAPEQMNEIESKEEKKSMEDVLEDELFKVKYRQRNIWCIAVKSQVSGL